jgi:hypothetical protein
MEDILLLNISNIAMTTYLFKGGGLGDNSLLIESVKIAPHYPFLKIVMCYLFTPLKATLYNLDTNVCFMEIDDKYSNIKISCDWCSICNGIVETAKQNIIKNPGLVKQIDFQNLKNMDHYLDFSLIDRTERITNDKIEQWCETTFGRKSTDLLLFSQIYLKIGIIELRWCPFKRSKELYYRNQDERYLEPTEQIIYEIGKILSTHETITCNNCPKVVNKEWKYTKSNQESIFQPLLDYMIEEISKS